MSVIAIPELDLMTLDVTSEEFRQGAVFAAQEFQDATARISEAMEIINYQQDRIGRDSITFSYNLQGYKLSPDEIVEKMKRDMWRSLVAKLRIHDVMSLARRKELDRQLESGELPDITPETIVSVIMGLAGNAAQYAEDAAKEVFEFLRPWSKEYKTNNAFKIGKRVILSYCVETGYRNAFRVQYGRRDQQLTMMDNVMHRLDGKGTLRSGKSPLIEAIESGDGKGETEYFKFKCYKNKNLHIEFKRLDLVKQINLLGMGEFVLGEADTEV